MSWIAFIKLVILCALISACLDTLVRLKEGSEDILAQGRYRKFFVNFLLLKAWMVSLGCYIAWMMGKL